MLRAQGQAAIKWQPRFKGRCGHKLPTPSAPHFPVPAPRSGEVWGRERVATRRGLASRPSGGLTAQSPSGALALHTRKPDLTGRGQVITQRDSD